jgi:hypothetical protein
MGIGNIQNKQVQQKEEPVKQIVKETKTEPFSTNKYTNCLAVCKWMDDGRLLPVMTEIKPGEKVPLVFYSVADYDKWVYSNGPDKNFKDPHGEYVVINKWQPK